MYKEYRMETLLNSTYMNSKKYCEHIDLHQDMYNKGYDKIYLNPTWYYLLDKMDRIDHKYLKNLVIFLKNR